MKFKLIGELEVPDTQFDKELAYETEYGLIEGPIRDNLEAAIEVEARLTFNVERIDTIVRLEMSKKG